MPDMTAAAVAAHRFGFGARPGELAEIAGDPRGWVLEQLRRPVAEPGEIAALPPAEDDYLAFGRWLAQRRLRDATDEQMADMAERAGVSEDELRALSLEDSYVNTFRPRMERAVAARIAAAAGSAAPVHERLVQFWGNHFTVSSLKPAAVALPPSFERDVARAHAQGRFAAMLIASCRHPGMLIYLDNVYSVGPNSPAGRTGRGAPRLPGGRGERARDLNENLAREVLELHTLGVDAGYTQDDVRSLAAILTGWTVDRPRLRDYLSDREGTRRGDALFSFEEALHEPGAHTVLGVSYGEDGAAQGEAALTALARRPETARFIAFKLTRHFLADAPPEPVLERVARAFLDSDGHLPTTMAALVESPEAWALPLTKFRRPEDYLIATLRAMNVSDLPAGTAAAALTTLGQRPYAAPGPNGWDDTESGWMGADLVWKRVEFAAALAERVARSDLDPLRLAQSACGPLLTADTIQALQRAESPAQGLTLFFASPELQRR